MGVLPCESLGVQDWSESHGPPTVYIPVCTEVV